MRLGLWAITACAVAMGCYGGSSLGPGKGPVMGANPVTGAACPVDPDCALTADGCAQYYVECEDYWNCVPKADGRGMRCENPGPDLPDNSQEWTCEDVGGATVCRGESMPDDGGDGVWNCEQAAEFVECTKGSPDYPDAHDDGPWYCWYAEEFRICENSPPTPTGPGDGGEWDCVEVDGSVRCTQLEPSYPDDGEWDCYDADGTTTCTRRPTGDGDHPDDGGDGPWTCESGYEFIVCTRPTPDHPDGGDMPPGVDYPGDGWPDDGGDGPWDCWYTTEEFRVCESGPPGDDGGGECVPGRQRWCDDARYCSWGKQTCRPDGRWGACEEVPTLGPEGLLDRPATECGCRFFYFNPECCESADCVIPEGHVPPACDADGGFCSYCDQNSDCGGSGDLCVLTSVDGHIGYSFCGQDCSDGATCPTGSHCEVIGTSSGAAYQCVPDAGACE